MRLLPFRSQSSRVMLLLLGVTVAASVALALLTWRLTVLDRAVQQQRTAERLQQAADSASTALLQQIARTGDRLRSILQVRDAGAMLQGMHELAGTSEESTALLAQTGALTLVPNRRLRYVPDPPHGNPVPDEKFAPCEMLEYSHHDYAAAAQCFRGLASRSNRALRAGALLGAARNDVKRNRLALALATYSELASSAPEIVDEEPIQLTARFARLGLLSDPERGMEASALARDLENGHWRISRATYEYYRSALGHSTRIEPTVPLWEVATETLLTVSRQPGMESGERVIWLRNSQPLLLIWRSRADSVAGFAATGNHIANDSLRGKPGFSFGIETADHQSLIPIRKSERTAERILSFAGTHWHLIASARAGTVEHNGSGTLLAAGLLLVTMLVVAGSLAVIKAVSRELSVAKLQTDFVSAVSHDFRTPLTTLRSMSEMLERNRVPTEERKRRYYELMSRETARLQRLVEDLLDFGRMDAGVRRYELRSLDIAELVHQTVQEFQDEHAGSGLEIEAGEIASVPVAVDGEAIRRALYNLLDNAVKYSPEGGVIRVQVRAESKRVCIAVEDHGMGIAPKDRKRIFRKFERGAAARSSSIRGTGLGLAMVHSIIKAHGGSVQVESELHSGSKFTLVLPCVERTEQRVEWRAS